MLAIGAGGLIAGRSRGAAEASVRREPEEIGLRGGLFPAAVFLVLVAALLRAQFTHAALGARLALALGLLLCGATLIMRSALSQRRMSQLLERERASRRALASREAELAALNERLSDDARRDPLTGMRNRRALSEDIATQETLARLQDRPFTVAICDVDCFKAYNDRLGHLAGDRALREIAAAIRAELRVGDVAYRYGGEEVVLLLRDIALDEARVIAERVRARVEALDLRHPAGVAPTVTVSIGLAAGMTGPALLESADAALYTAKGDGRNRVVAASDGVEALGRRPVEPLAPGERQLRGVIAISKAGAAGRGPMPVLEALADFIRGEMGYQTVAVNLHDQAAGVLEVVHVLGDEEVRRALDATTNPWEDWQRLLELGETPGGAVWLPAGTAVPDSLTAWTPRHSPVLSPDAWRVEDMLLLPLRDAAGAVLAVVSIDEPLHGARPDAAELRTLMAAAEHAALTLEHATRADRSEPTRVTHPDVLLAAVMLLAETLDLRDAGTAEHSCVVGGYARETAVELGLDADRVERVHAAAVLHDLGKVGIADAVLRKPGPLHAAEWEEMRRHPEIGARILERAGLDDLAHWVLCHHERIDGSGYPHGLGEDEIPLEARILAVVDAYEAMTADRPYRARLSAPEACAELVRSSGTQFDSVVVEAFSRSRGASSEAARGHAARRRPAAAPA